jgi:hypothetical protein
MKVSRLYKRATRQLGAATRSLRVTLNSLACSPTTDAANSVPHRLLENLRWERQHSPNPASYDTARLAPLLSQIASTGPESWYDYQAVLGASLLGGANTPEQPEELLRFVPAEGFFQRVVNHLLSQGQSRPAAVLRDLLRRPALPDLQECATEVRRNWRHLAALRIAGSVMYVTDATAAFADLSARGIHNQLALWKPACIAMVRFRFRRHASLQFPTSADAGLCSHFLPARLTAKSGLTAPHDGITPGVPEFVVAPIELAHIAPEEMTLVT